MRKWFVLLALVLAACGEPDSMPSDGGTVRDAALDRDGGVVEDSGVDAGSDRDAGPDDAGPRIALGGVVDGVIGEPGEVDSFALDVVGGQFIGIVAVAPTIGGQPSRLDPVIQLRDPSGTLIAEADYRIPALNQDAELIFYAPATARYVVSVMDASALDGPPFQVGGPNYFYRLRVDALVAAPGTTLDEERGDDAATAQLADLGASGNLTVGSFRDATDVDVYRVTISASDAIGDTWQVYESGRTGNGSTDPSERVWLTTLDGATTVASIAPSEDYRAMSSPGPGEYLLWIAPNPSGPGANGFYAIRRVQDSSVIAEPNEGTNDTVAGARVADHTALSGYFEEHIWGLLPAGDVDHFVYAVGLDVGIYGGCFGEASGSGLRELRVEVIAPDGTVVSENVDRSYFGADINTRTATTGVHVIRVSGGGQDPEVVGVHYRCYVLLID